MLAEDVNPILQVVTTKASEGVEAIHFAKAGDDAPAAVRAAYPYQISIRIEETRGLLVYDVCDFMPDDPNGFFPVRESLIRKVEKTMSMNYESDDSDEGEDEEDPIYEGFPPSREKSFYFQAQQMRFKQDGRHANTGACCIPSCLRRVAQERDKGWVPGIAGCRQVRVVREVASAPAGCQIAR